MGFFKRAELEFMVALSSDAPSSAHAYTNWPYYLTRLQRCEGFTATEDQRPDESSRVLSGYIDLSEYNYLWLRKHMGSEAAENRFWAERAKLQDAEAEPQASPVQVLAGEKETVIHAEASEPYWLRITTEMAHWLRRLDEHPYAVKVAETIYADDSRQATYLLPRKLLTIRARRPRLSEAQLSVLRERWSAKEAS